ncbi:maleylpyruvate isomerase N-terminal domain-containing protein [Sinirhodobacter sp. WL0062]|uniref:Maleylpyruvate isomerase N-terminal domain-containing protein n=1 Tax=Rhodobacter flavimaris TaxID=2907145 RepID=A0ABS8YZM3_9RHOB|nr:maleylpyruvate isomerase N-terminal domain-containing protein [Sinirhodobacter sp. WL0062]MCE5973130.1 maleylpyruvate isomerase N-terminal domain-containing protein [Sinirhodobacter sp. WL0062]
MSTLDEAREALRLLQGLGARYDAPEAPAQALALARSGTAYFARKLNELSDVELYGPSRVTGWTRAHVICDVAYQARAIAAQAEALTAGSPAPPFYESEAARLEAIDLGATLPPRALRHLADHSAVHLDVVWRDLPGACWSARASDAQGADRAMSDTATERTRLLWQAALDLDNGARLRDVPVQLRPQTAH